MVKSKAFDCIETITGQGDIAATVIWLHGLGADANDFLNIIPMLQLPPDKAIRFIFPNAPIRPVSINGGLPCRAWFDIYSLDDWQKRDNDGIADAVCGIQSLIQAQIEQGISSHNIVLAGFSQGGMVALLAGLQLDKQLGGVLALSTCLPYDAAEVARQLGPAMSLTPVMQMHGKHDDVLPFALGQISFQLLKQLSCSIEFSEYNMGHEVCPQQILDIGLWLQQCINQSVMRG